MIQMLALYLVDSIMRRSITSTLEIVTYIPIHTLPPLSLMPLEHPSPCTLATLQSLVELALEKSSFWHGSALSSMSWTVNCFGGSNSPTMVSLHALGGLEVWWVWWVLWCWERRKIQIAIPTFVQGTESWVWLFWELSSFGVLSQLLSLRRFMSRQQGWLWLWQARLTFGWLWLQVFWEFTQPPRFTTVNFQCMNSSSPLSQ